MRHLTKDQLRSVARRLRQTLPPAPELPPTHGTVEHWAWTYRRSPQLAIEHEAMREAYREWKHYATESLAIELAELCGCGRRLAKFIAEQVMREPQLPKSQSDASGKQAGNKRENQRDQIDTFDSRRLVSVQSDHQPKKLPQSEVVKSKPQSDVLKSPARPAPVELPLINFHGATR